MAKADIRIPGPDLLPCSCGGETWLKKEEITLYKHSSGWMIPLYITRYAIYCDACNAEVSSDRLDLTVSTWNKIIKTRLDEQSRTGRLIEC